MEPTPPQTPTPPAPPPAVPPSHTTEQGPGTGKTILVFLLLFFFYPVGVVLMTAWMKWSLAVKIVIAIVIPFLMIFILGILSSLLVAMINPMEQLKKAELEQLKNTQLSSCQAECSTTTTDACVTACLENYKAPTE